MLCSHVFEAGTGDKVMLVCMDQSFQTFDDFIVRKSKTHHVQAQHLRNHLLEVHQLQQQTEPHESREQITATLPDQTQSEHLWKTQVCMS